MTVNILVFLSATALFCQSFVAADSDVNTGSCKLDKYNLDHELKAVEKIRDLIGKVFTSQDAQGKWSFTVGICADLELEDAVKDAGAVQRQLPGGAVMDKTIHNIGSLSKSHLMAGKDWAMLEYRGGESDEKFCGEEHKRTVVMLTCDESIDDSDAKMVHIEGESGKEGDCYYLFEMKHMAVCPKSSGSVLSVGSILLITFFSVVALYLFLGFLYQRFVLGSKGKEQIPNYEFWKDLGNLEADGCDFVCRSRSRQTNGFSRGIGDDQLDVTEEIRDDNLLPM